MSCVAAVDRSTADHFAHENSAASQVPDGSTSGLITVALTLVIAGACGRQHMAPPAAAEQRPSAVSVVGIDRALLRWVDSSRKLVVVLRDAEVPDRPLESGRILITPVRVPRRTVGGATKADGSAEFAKPDTGLVEVEAVRIGYQPFRFQVHLNGDCRQTLEVYIGRQVTFMDGPARPLTPGRAVLTTCVGGV